MSVRSPTFILIRALLRLKSGTAIQEVTKHNMLKEKWFYRENVLFVSFPESLDLPRLLTLVCVCEQVNERQITYNGRALSEHGWGANSSSPQSLVRNISRVSLQCHLQLENKNINTVM